MADTSRTYEKNIIWGRNTVLEALRAGRPMDRITLKKGVRPVGPVAEIMALAKARGVRVEWDDEQRFSSIPGAHQGVLAQVQPYRYADVGGMLALPEQRGETPLLLLLDSVQDPQNFGTLLRTAEAVGVHGVIVPEHRAAGVTPGVEKASAGAVEHLKIAQVTNLNRTIEQLKEHGLWIVAVEADAPQDYDELDYRMPLALVLGSEARGISPLTRSKCDLSIRLPMRGRVDSLNVAIAGSIILYHVWRQRTAPGARTPAQRPRPAVVTPPARTPDRKPRPPVVAPQARTSDRKPRPPVVAPPARTPDRKPRPPVVAPQTRTPDRSPRPAAPEVRARGPQPKGQKPEERDRRPKPRAGEARHPSRPPSRSSPGPRRRPGPPRPPRRAPKG